MSTDSFIFIAVCLLILPLQQIGAEALDAVSVAICLGAILTLGISHGAIDNVLYGINRKISNTRFISIYLVAIGLNVLLWIISPNLGAASFLIISAYHFGQSQLSEIKNTIDILRRAIFFMWGCSLLMALIHFNRMEILNYPADISLLNLPFFEFLVENSHTLWISTTLLWLVPLAIIEIIINQQINYLLLQIYFMLLISFAFVLFSTLVGFTLYFAILHSLRVLMQEYREIRTKNPQINPVKFIRLLMPFTAISVMGTVCIMFLHQTMDWSISTGLMVAIIISSITLPHSYVMELFYHQSRFHLR